jgi:hypothetical protein
MGNGSSISVWSAVKTIDDGSPRFKAKRLETYKSSTIKEITAAFNY